MLTTRHDEDIYVIGSGASLSFVNPRFFDNKIIVATNLAAHGLGLTAKATYVHSHYHENVAFQYHLHPDWVFVTPAGDRGFAEPRKTAGENGYQDVWYYEHYPTGEYEAGKGWHPDGLIVGPSSIHGSMHLAALLGAKNIILCGADCGLIDGKSNYDGYCDEQGNTQSGDLINNDTLRWLGRWDHYLRMVRDDLVKHYGVNVVSLNPFVNFNLEGHTFLGGHM